MRRQPGYLPRNVTFIQERGGKPAHSPGSGGRPPTGGGVADQVGFGHGGSSGRPIPRDAPAVRLRPCALLGEPRLLLLDEPIGAGSIATHELYQPIDRLRQGAPVSRPYRARPGYLHPIASPFWPAAAVPWATRPQAPTGLAGAGCASTAGGR